MDYDFYMRRALTLARGGEGSVSPNPMVGAVIADSCGRIIGEGWHRQYGGPHAEVNAIRSVSAEDMTRLHEATMFVTLEPCAHHGKTPPCADLLVEKKIGTVVIGTRDPFADVDGKGIKRLTDAGINVVTGVLEKECREINKTFFFAHLKKRPYITLKWAQSADGFMDSKSRHPYVFSNVLTRTMVHRLRALNDAVLTSTATVIADNPRLDIRFWKHGRCPRPVVIGTSEIPGGSKILENGRLLIEKDHSLKNILENLYAEHGITSALVEGGPVFLKAFIKNELWNEARIEVTNVRLGSDGTKSAPSLNCLPDNCMEIDGNRLFHYINPTSGIY